MDQESRYKMIKKYAKNFCKVRNPSNSMEDLVPDLWKSDSEMDVLIVEKKGTVIRSCFLTIFEEVSLGYVLQITTQQQKMSTQIEFIYHFLH